jgi:hypothetical protein
MRQLLLAIIVVAGCTSQDDCAVNQPCSTGSANHYQFCNGGTADNCYYITGDGHRFHCLTCGDCTEARAGVTAWCAAAPTSTSSSHGNYTCSQTVSCPGGGKSYSACATPTGSQCTYKTSDGSFIDCSACSDCNAAVQRVLDWCNGASSSSGGSTTGGSAGDDSCFSQATSACQACCAGHHPDGSNYFADAYVTCGCSYCTSACNTAGDVCHGGSSQSAECASCFSTTVQQNCGSQITTSCANNSACSTYLSCVQRC